MKKLLLVLASLAMIMGLCVLAVAADFCKADTYTDT